MSSSAAPRLVALFGDPINESLSPAIHNAAFTARGLNWSYLSFRADAASLPALFRKLREGGLAAANFTYPCKEAAVGLCDTLDAWAGDIQAVNTARLVPGAVEGFNTDVTGFYQSLADLGADVKGRAALVLGAGPAARAAAVALENAGAAVLTFAVRDATRPRPGVSPQATVIRVTDINAFLRERPPDLLVNATPARSAADMAFLDFAEVPGSCFIYDLNYGPAAPLRELALARRLRYADGLNMLVRQGALAFQIWTGAEPPVETMFKAAETELRKRG